MELANQCLLEFFDLLSPRVGTATEASVHSLRDVGASAKSSKEGRVSELS